MELDCEVAIVGGGASGTLTAAWILRLARAPVRVALIDGAGRFGAGAAYGTREPVHLLNVPAGRMSADPDRPDHLVRWARRRGLPVTADSFLPRVLYAEYLRDFLADAEQRARHGVELLRVPVAATRIAHGRVHLDGGDQVRCEKVVLASGNLPPRGLAVPGAEQLAAAGLDLGSPWSGRLRRIDPSARVLVLGTGLTAIDALLTLEARGHQGKIVAISRHGLLPQAHRAWTQVIGVPAPMPGSPRVLLQWVRVLSAEAEARGGTWREVVDAIRPVAQRTWSGWTHAERARFLRHLRRHWDAHRHRMAPEVADRIDQLRRRGQLQLVAGRVERFELIEGAVRVDVRSRGGGAKTFTVEAVINATGPAPIESSPLVRALLEDGLAKRDALGIETWGGAVVDGRGTPSSWLFTLGPLRIGELWETTAIPELRLQAKKLGRELAPRAPVVEETGPGYFV